MRRIAAVAFTFGWLAACENATPPTAPTQLSRAGTTVAAAKIANYWYDFNSLLFNPCNSEWVAATGKVHFVITGDAGSEKVRANIADFHGVGLTSGDSYTFSENLKQDVEISGPDFSVEVRDYYRVIRQGSGDNYYQLIHYRFSTSGGFEIIDQFAECRG